MDDGQTMVYHPSSIVLVPNSKETHYGRTIFRRTHST